MVFQEYELLEDVHKDGRNRIEEDDTDESGSDDDSETESDDSDDDSETESDDDSEEDSDEEEDSTEESAEEVKEPPPPPQDTRDAHEIRQDLIRGIQGVSTDLDYLLENLHKEYKPIGIPKLNPPMSPPHVNRGRYDTPMSPQINHYEYKQQPRWPNYRTEQPRSPNYPPRSPNYPPRPRPNSQPAKYTPRPQPMDAASIYSKNYSDLEAHRFNQASRRRKEQRAWDQSSTFSHELIQHSRRLNSASAKKKFKPRTCKDLYRHHRADDNLRKMHSKPPPAQNYPNPAVPPEELRRAAGRVNMQNKMLDRDHSFKVTEAELIKKASNILLDSDEGDDRKRDRSRAYERQIASFM